MQIRKSRIYISTYAYSGAYIRIYVYIYICIYAYLRRLMPAQDARTTNGDRAGDRDRRGAR